MTIDWKGWILQDWQRKLVALLLAIIIWYAVSAQQQQTKSVTVPVQFRVDDPNVRLVDPADLPLVSLTLRGSSRNLDQVTNNNVQVEHQIKEWPGTGDYEAFILERDVRDLPHGVHVVEVTPNKVSVPLDMVVQKRLEVVPTFSGELRAGWERRRTDIVPRAVEVKGLRREVENLEEITTEPIHLGDDIPSRFEIDVKVKPPTGTIEIVGRDSVSVTVELRYTLVEKLLTGLQLQVLNRRDSEFYISKLDWPPYEQGSVQVVIEGPTEAIDRLDSTNNYVRAFIDVTGEQQAGEVVLPVRIWLNARGCRVRDQSLQPATVRATIARRPQPPEPPPPAPEEPPAVVPEEMPEPPPVIDGIPTPVPPDDNDPAPQP